MTNKMLDRKRRETDARRWYRSTAIDRCPETIIIVSRDRRARYLTWVKSASDRFRVNVLSSRTNNYGEKHSILLRYVVGCVIVRTIEREIEPR